MKIIAIGGGEIGRIKIHPDGRREQMPAETTAIDKKTIEMSGKASPNLLFIGTAKNDSAGYLEAVANHFSKRLGCNVIGDLKLAEVTPTESEMRAALNHTDIIYVGGGDTRFLMERWHATGFDKLVKEYGARGLVLSGLSAGAVCWFDWYDNDEYIAGDWSKLDFLPGLRFIKGFAIPHYDNEKHTTSEKRAHIGNLLKKEGVVSYMIDDAAAVVFDNGNVSFISSKPDAKVNVIKDGVSVKTKKAR